MKSQSVNNTANPMHRQFEGAVVGTAMMKTIRVAVKSVKMHKKYRKQYSRTSVYPVHDEQGKAKVGDTVLFQECRPISKTKKWRLIKVVT